ncbi:MAG: hypothetical protein HFE78_07450 [Clostridiales bacterium]|nr:hypothetical protein [Clostridiales bacterium]
MPNDSPIEVIKKTVIDSLGSYADHRKDIAKYKKYYEDRLRALYQQCTRWKIACMSLLFFVSCLIAITVFLVINYVQ